MMSDSATSNVYTLSWLAYVRPLIVSVVIGVVGLIIAGIAERQWLIGAAVIIAIAWLIYQVMYLRSIKLFANDSGVWIYQGVLPWQKGFNGVKWRDVDGALYSRGFISWACGSYAIHVGHRYTKGCEIAIPHVRHGHRFVEYVNDEHQRKISEPPAPSPSQEDSLIED